MVPSNPSAAKRRSGESSARSYRAALPLATRPPDGAHPLPAVDPVKRSASPAHASEPCRTPGRRVFFDDYEGQRPGFPRARENSIVAITAPEFEGPHIADAQTIPVAIKGSQAPIQVRGRRPGIGSGIDRR